MFVCLCKAVTDRRIVQLVQQGVTTVKGIQNITQAGSECGACLCKVSELLADSKKTHCANVSDVPKS